MIAPEKLLEAAKALEPQLQEWRRTLHRHPEVGFDLPQTKALVKKALTEMGYTPQDCGKCGVVAPPWCWVQPSCSRSTRTRSRAR